MTLKKNKHKLLVKLKTGHMVLFLSFLFLLYSFSIYLKPLYIHSKINFDQKKAIEGRLVWQSYNCQSCHQLYGLGGYLGPDLTNVYSKPSKGESVIKLMVKYGVKQMPTYNIPDKKLSELIEFLKSTDASGKSDPRIFITTKTGMIERHDKN